MTTAELERRLKTIAETPDRTDFIYDLLLACDIPKGTVTRLRKGILNLSKTEGEVHYDKKIFFKKVAKGAQLLATVDELKSNERIRKKKTRLILVTDGKSIAAADLKKGLQPQFSYEELPAHAAFFLPLAGAELYKSANDNKADREAAYKLGLLYEELVAGNPETYQQNPDPHTLNVLLARLLFCFFAEDTGIFPEENLFTNALANRTPADGLEVAPFLEALFRRLQTDRKDFEPWLQAFPYVNGGLFSEVGAVPVFTAKARSIMLECGDLDWSEINPDIFGSMIQAVTELGDRSQLGMHYTSVPNILKVIRPLFLDGLEAALDKATGNETALKKLALRLSRIKFFDPACGSGNFLIITYKEIRRLEVEIIRELIAIEEAQGKRTLHCSAIRLSQFYGIEIKDFAHEMALLSLWLAEHQMNQYFDDQLADYGQSEPMLPLRENGRIVQGNAARLSWETVCPRTREEEVYIMGNPPYLGYSRRESEQTIDVEICLGSIPQYKKLDYVFCWFKKAVDYIESNRSEFAFVTTNSITQGEQVAIGFPYILDKGCEISFAHQSFKWTNNARGNAGVSVVIIGIRNESNKPKRLYTLNYIKDARNISPYLIDCANFFIKSRNEPLSTLPVMIKGSSPNDDGNLILNEEEYQKIINEDSMAKNILKKYLGNKDFIYSIKRYCIYISKAQEINGIKSKIVHERIEKVRDFRLRSSKVATRNKAATPYRFDEDKYSEKDFILVPQTGSDRREYMPIGVMSSDYVPSNACRVIYDFEPFVFGIISSRMHLIWVKTLAGRMKDDVQYSNTLCYNTFPFPEINTRQKETLNQYVLEVIDAREQHAGRTLAWMYDPDTMPQNLREAHHALDAAVERIYRPHQPFGSDVERLEHLFKRYEEMVQAETLFARPQRRRL